MDAELSPMGFDSFNVIIPQGSNNFFEVAQTEFNSNVPSFRVLLNCLV